VHRNSARPHAHFGGPGAGARPPPGIPPRELPPDPVPSRTAAPREGRWAWTCRAGFERHLYEELRWSHANARLLGPALVEADRPVRDLPAFGRMGFQVIASGEPGADLALAAAKRVADRLVWVQAWTLDTDLANPLSPLAAELGEAARAQLPEERRARSAWDARDRGGVLLQLCVASPELAIAGAVEARDAASLAAGGRQRMHRGDAPSRAAAKLEEALEVLGLSPGRGEECVDLGAAPGGWTRRLVSRGARVTAVDPARLSADLASNRLVRHVQDSAFAYAPQAPVDWLFCDMAWRPLEVAQLLAKWGRRGWATHLVANIKLPMKDKNPMLFRVRRILEEEGGWRHLRVRQLYHDRDEVTVMARRL